MKIQTLWAWSRGEEVPTLLLAEDEFTCLPDEWPATVAEKIERWERAGYYDFFERVLEVSSKAILEGSSATIVAAVVSGNHSTPRPELPPNATLKPDGAVVVTKVDGETYAHTGNGAVVLGNGDSVSVRLPPVALLEP